MHHLHQTLIQFSDIMELLTIAVLAFFRPCSQQDSQLLGTTTYMIICVVAGLTSCMQDSSEIGSIFNFQVSSGL